MGADGRFTFAIENVNERKQLFQLLVYIIQSKTRVPVLSEFGVVMDVCVHQGIHLRFPERFPRSQHIPFIDKIFTAVLHINENIRT